MGPWDRKPPLLYLQSCCRDRLNRGRDVGTDEVGGEREQRCCRVDLELALMSRGDSIQQEARGGG